MPSSSRLQTRRKVCDKTILIDGDQRYEGRTELASWDQYDNVGVQSQLAVAGWVVFFQGFRVYVRVTGNGFNGIGEMKFQLLDGKIALLRISV
jgi:hypothetical protein